MKLHSSRLLGVAAVCVALGAGIGAITSASASTGAAPHRAHSGSAASRVHGRAGRLMRRAVQGEFVVATRSGFKTVSFERGTVESVNGQQLTIAEGTAKQSYKTVTVTIPTAARVRVAGHRSTLSALQKGERVRVLLGPKRTFVSAHTP